MLLFKKDYLSQKAGYMKRDELTDTLLGIDEEVALSRTATAAKSVVVIVGGAAFLLRDLTTRTVTHDIDVLQADSAVRHVLAEYPNVNGAVAAYADQIPYNFEDRLVPLKLPTQAVEYVTPSAEDLTVMKLYAQRPNDMQDIESAAQQGKLNWSLLDMLVFDPDEAAASSLSPRRYGEMVDAYKRFRERFLGK